MSDETTTPNAEQSESQEDDILSIIDGEAKPDAGDTGDHGDDESGDSPPPSDEGEEGQEEAEDKKGKGVQKRISELTKARREAERREQEARDAKIAAEARTKALEELYGRKEDAPAGKSAEDDPEPKPEDFKDMDAYEDARLDWKVRQRVKAEYAQRQAMEKAYREQAESRAKAEEAEKRVVEFVTKAEERFKGRFREAVAPIADVLDKTSIGSAAMRHADGADILMYLANKPEVLDKITKLSPIEQAMEVGALAERIKVAREAKARTKADEPLTPVKGRAPAGKDLHSLPMEEFAKIRNAQEAKKR